MATLQGEIEDDSARIQVLSTFEDNIFKVRLLLVILTMPQCQNSMQTF